MGGLEATAPMIVKGASVFSACQGTMPKIERKISQKNLKRIIVASYELSALGLAPDWKSSS